MFTRYAVVLSAVLLVSSCQSAKNDGSAVDDGGSLASGEKTDKIGELLSGAFKNSEKKQEKADQPHENEVVETPTKNKPKAVSKEVASNSVAEYVPPKKGTVFTWHNNWANLPKIISYKVAGTLSKGGTEYVKFSSVEGFKNTTHAYYDTKNFGLKGYRDKSDNAVITFKPVEQRYRFPMAPGDKWLTQWKQIDHKTDRVTSGGGVVHVMRWETLNLPAGKFRTLKVKMPVQKSAPKGLTHFAWFSPELGVTVKEEIGGGILNWSQVLEKVKRPK